jgi:uncharacterized phiE125 gp8 family phage protein
VAVLTLNEAKAHLNITSTTQDDELQTFMAAAEAAIERRVGPLVATSVTSRVAGGGELVLPFYPVLSVTAIADRDGNAVSVSDVYADSIGVVTGTYGFPSLAYDVTYQAGHAATAADVPADLRLAILEMVRHLWESQRRSRGQVTDVPGSAHAFPYRVEELLAPYVQFGIA